jgi:hypothetical protein
MIIETVIVTLDQSAGVQIIRWADRAHVWALASEPNQQAVRTVWAKGDASKGATIFNADPLQSPEEQFLNELDEIILHHPSWSELEVHGIKYSSAIRVALQEVIAADLHIDLADSIDGFIIRRKNLSMGV